MNIKKKTLAAGAALALVPTGLAALATSAHADAGAWYPAVGSTVLTAGQVINVGGNISLTATFNGIPGTQVNCTLPSGAIKVTTPTPVPSAAPGGTISLPVTMPAVLSSSDPSDPEYNQCTDTYTGDADDVTTNGAAWSVNVTMPGGTTPSPYTGTLSGSLSVPQYAMRVSTPLVPNCELRGPTAASPAPITGTYNATSGSIVPAGGQTVGVQVTPHSPPYSCTVGPTAAIAAGLTLSPVLDMVYVP